MQLDLGEKSKVTMTPALVSKVKNCIADFTQPYHTMGLLFLLAVAPFTAAAGDNTLFPLEPPDTSSPRATIESFMRNSSEGASLYLNGRHKDEILPWFQRANHCLDLSHVSPDRLNKAATEAALLLYEVLNRTGIPDLETIPDLEAVEEKAIQRWIVPRTQIALTRIEEGDRKGEFLFSTESVKKALDYYESVRQFPYNSGYSPGTYEKYVSRPDFRVPYTWADDLPAWANKRILRNPVWKHLALIVIAVMGVAIAYLVYRLAGTWNRRYTEQGARRGVGTLVFAVGLVVIPLTINVLLDDFVGIRFGVQAVVSKLLLATAFVAAVFAVFVLVEFVANVLISSRRVQQKSVDAQFIRVSARIIAIIAGIFVVVQASEYLGYELTPVLAGLGIGGLAVALAARPTLENIIGGFTLFADRPVKVGDYCRFGEQEGTVVDIGLRSTRLRLRDDTLVSVPNANFAQMELHNHSQRRQRLYRPIIGLRYETTSEQLRFVLAKLREMLLAHPRVSSDPMFVRFMGFGAYSLDIEMFASTKASNWLEYRAIREDLNFRIMEIVKEAGTGFAFPSQTNYYTRDSGLDAERSQEAEERVQFWRSRNKLPFPEHELEDQDQLEDTLDYPPKGSPDYVKRED